jgi:phosphoribosylformimino-5-aminoimidazole carboxamide ribotide isomerase
MSIPPKFHVYPAIDLIGGRAVRLEQGSYDRQLDIADDPLARAEAVWEAGSSALHIIDLDAARAGARSDGHTALIAEIARQRPAGTILQVGGGLRDAAIVADTLDLGVDRVLLGTLAVTEPNTLAELVRVHGSAVAVALDSRAGSVRTGGWLEDAGIPVDDAARSVVEAGVETLLITAIDRDGTLGGPDLDLLKRIRAVLPGASVIAAGGVADPEDVTSVRAIGCAGAVVGRAWLEQPGHLPAFIAAGT